MSVLGFYTVLFWYLSSVVYPYLNDFQCTRTEQAMYSNLSTCQQRRCSQKRRYPTDSYFQCTIGMQTEWEEFKETNHVLESYEQSSSQIKSNPPSISAVGFYLIADRNNVFNNPNLNLTFRLPRNNAYDTKALLVKFVGMNDSRYPELQDPFYKDNPRYRLFNFPLYKTPEEDKVNPREIVYGCFMGLDCQEEKRVYLITLTAYTMDRNHPGSSVTYHFTVYTTRDFTNTGKVTVAVAFLYNKRTIHVVFEPIAAAHVLPDTYYDVTLMEINTGKLQTVQIQHKNHRYEHEFPDVTNGSYTVEVNVRNCIGLNPCPLSQSGIFEVEYKTSPTSTGKTLHTSPDATIYAIIGAIGGTFLLIVLLACFMVSIDHRPKVYILSFCEIHSHTEVSKALKQCVHHLFDTTIVATVDSESVKHLSSKGGFYNNNNVIIATKCQHVTEGHIEKLCTKVKADNNALFICFSQTDVAMSPHIDKSFLWNQNNGCIEMIKYIKDRQNTHCINVLKHCRPQLQTVSEDSEEFQHLQRTIDLAQPVYPPAEVPCPIHTPQPDDVRKPLLQEYDSLCPVHSTGSMPYDWGNYTQSFNIPPFSDHYDSKIVEPISDLDMDILSEKMLKINEEKIIRDSYT